MHTAKGLFEQKGVNEVTIDDITEKSDVSRSTFFNHFQSTNDLLIQIARQEIAELIDAINEKKDGDVLKSLMHKLLEDTYPYPYLMFDFLTRGILNEYKNKLENNEYTEVLKIFEQQFDDDNKFKSREKTSIVLGSYFGFLIMKFIKKEKFDDLNEAKSFMNKIIEDLI